MHSKMSPIKFREEYRLKNGQTLVLRLPTKSDARSLHAYINTLSLERTFVSFQGEEVSFKEEQEYVDGLVKKIANQQVFHLLGFIDDQLVTAAGIELQPRTESHQGLLGISVAKEHRGKGIGQLVMEVLVEKAPKYLPQLKIITLQHMGNNLIGRRLYEKMGFIEYGRLKQGMKHRDQYVDEVLMYKKVTKDQS